MPWRSLALTQSCAPGGSRLSPAQAATQAQGTHEALEAIRKPTVEKWMRCGLVQVGVALPDGACFRIGEVEEDGEDELRDAAVDAGVSAHEPLGTSPLSAAEAEHGAGALFDVITWTQVEMCAEGAGGGEGGRVGLRTMRARGLGSGFCIDGRGVVLTDEHVRSQAQLLITRAAEAGFPGGCLVFAAYKGGEIEWERAWVARVLAYTENWEHNWDELRSHAPDPHVQPLEGFSCPLTLTQRYADVAAICAVRELASSRQVSMRPGSVLRIPAGGGAAPGGGAVPGGGVGAVTLGVMPQEISGPLVGERLWAVGYPNLGGSKPMPIECRLVSSIEDTHGEWLQIDGNILPGHSGGPIVNSSGAVVAWVVRDYIEGIRHARHIAAAWPCIEAALAHAALRATEV